LGRFWKLSCSTHYNWKYLNTFNKKHR
jgi:hypothetical protein